MAAGSTYTPLTTTTLGSAQASVTFSSISGSYTDLVLICSGGANDSTIEIGVGNGSIDTGSNYSRTYLYGNGTSALSSRSSNISVTYETFGALTGIGSTILNFMNYSNTTTFKTIISRGNDASGNVVAQVSLWRSTSAINIIKVAGYNGNLASGSTFTLYGISAA